LSGNRGVPIFYSAAMEMVMRQHEEQSARADKTERKNKANTHDKKRQRKPSPPENAPIPLGERLRRWAREHDWYQGGHIDNHLVLKRAFLRPVRAAVNGFLSHERFKLAMEVKSDFDALLSLIKRFDKQCRTGCSEDFDEDVCEFLREKIHMAIDDLAARLDNRDLEKDCPGASAATVATSLNPDHWITFGQASEILAVSKPTLTRWLNAGKLTCNGQPGRRRKLNKVSVLLQKQTREDTEILTDAKDLRHDGRRLDALHNR
jgi:hypothetical protein